MVATTITRTVHFSVRSSFFSATVTVSVTVIVASGTAAFGHYAVRRRKEKGEGENCHTRSPKAKLSIIKKEAFGYMQEFGEQVLPTTGRTGLYSRQM
jgi:hypothetical protein